MLCVADGFSEYATYSVALIKRLVHNAMGILEQLNMVVSNVHTSYGANAGKDCVIGCLYCAIFDPDGNLILGKIGLSPDRNM